MSLLTTARRRAGIAAAVVATAAATAAAPAAATNPAADTGSGVVLDVTNATYISGNDYRISAGGTSGVSLDVAGSNFDPANASNVTPGFIQATLCTTLRYAGAYLSVGAVDPAGWQPSGSFGSTTREAGPTTWANTSGAVYNRGAGCPGTLIADQTTLSGIGDVTTTINVPFCWDGTDYHVKGTRVGANGANVNYDVNVDDGLLHLYSIGALTTRPSDLEQVSNVEVTNISRARSC